ncbi:MAG TPA: DUF3710 domain-containing protein [Pseudonocardia sp.]|jgi:hypothetical protein|nr:DUF3710 domain-containing protein [Pseudonocardia sp.]
MAELGQAGNTRTAGGSARGVLLDFGSVRVQAPSDAQLKLDAVESQLVRVDTSMGRIDLCVLAAPRSNSLWSRMSRDVAASQAGKGARVHTEPGEWGDEVLAARDGQLSRYVAMDGPGWMLFGLALGPEETTVELAETLRSMMRSALVRRGNEPMPEKTALPMTVPPGLARSGYSGADVSSAPEADDTEADDTEGADADGAGARQAGPVFQLGPTGSRQARGVDRARSNSGHGPATRPGSVARHGSATRHGSTAPAGPASRSGSVTGSGTAARAGAVTGSGAAGSGPGRDNRVPAAPTAAPVPEQRRGRWARAGQVSLVLGVVACLAVMLGWMFSGNGSTELHYTPAVALPPQAEGPTPGNDLALGNLPETPPGSAAEGQPSQSAPDLAPNSGQVTPPKMTPPKMTPPNVTPPNVTPPNHLAPNHLALKHPAGKPATQATARAAHGPARSGRSVTSAPAISGGSVPQHRATVQAPPTRSGDDAKTHSGDESTSRDGDESTSSDDRHSDHSSRSDSSHSGSSSDDSDHHDHRRDRGDVPPLGGVGRTLGGLGLPVGG